MFFFFFFAKNSPLFDNIFSTTLKKRNKIKSIAQTKNIMTILPGLPEVGHNPAGDSGRINT